MAYAFTGQMELTFENSAIEGVLHQGLTVTSNPDNAPLCVIKVPTTQGANYYLCRTDGNRVFNYGGHRYDNSSTATSIEPIISDDFHGTLQAYIDEHGNLNVEQLALNGVCLTDYGQGVTGFQINIPMFNADQVGTKEFTDYVENGDDHGAINYDDVHAKTYTFYISNDGETIKITYEDRSGDVDKMDYYQVVIKYGISQFEAVDKGHGQTNIQWNAFSKLATTCTVYIIGRDKTGESLFDLQAECKRKLLIVGEVDTKILVGESNGSVLKITSGGNIDDITQENKEESDAEEDKHTPARFDGYSKLLTTYRLSESDLEQLGQFIWSNDIRENLYLFNNDPMENLVSLKYVPISLPMQRASNVMIGNVDTGVVANEIKGLHIGKKTVGSITVPQYTDGFLNYGFTKIQLYLPLYGMVDLKSEDCVGYTITVTFGADVVCGTYMYCVYTNKGGGKTLIFSCSGDCAINIPLTQSNCAQLETGYISNLANAVGSAFAMDIGGALGSLVSIYSAQHKTQTFQSPSNMLGAISPSNCYLIVRYPIVNNPVNFAHTHGWLCMQKYTLSTLKGFTKVHNSVELSGIQCTETEREQIKQLLTSGIYL